MVWYVSILPYADHPRSDIPSYRGGIFSTYYMYLLTPLAKMAAGHDLFSQPLVTSTARITSLPWLLLIAYSGWYKTNTILSNKQKCTLEKYPLSSWSGFCDLMIKSQLLMGASHSYSCAHCRCSNFWGQVDQVELSGNGISSSQHLQDFRNIPASQWGKRGENCQSSMFFDERWQFGSGHSE